MQHVQKIESLFEEIKKGHLAASDELFEIIWLNHTVLPQEGAKPLLDKMLVWAKAHAEKYPAFFAFTNLAVGAIAHHADNFDDAMHYCTVAQQLFADLKDADGVAICDTYIGFVYRSLGEVDLALKYGLQGIEQLNSSGAHKMFLIIAYYWIGGIYADTGQLDESLNLFQRGLKIDYAAGIDVMQARFINGIAGVYMKQKKYELALEYYLKALEVSNEKEPTFKARGLTDLGDYYLKMGDYVQAIKYNEEALAIRKGMNVLNGAVTNLMNLGSILNKQGKFNDAVVMLKQALKLAEEIRVKSKMYQVHHTLSDIYLAMGNMPEAMAHHKAFHEIQEDVNHEDMERKVKNQQRLFEAEQTKKENTIIKAQKAEIEHKNVQLQDTIEELTITKVSRRAKAITLFIAVALIVVETVINHYVVSPYAHNNFFIVLASEGVIVLLLKPIETVVERYLLARVIKKRKQAKAEIMETI